MSAKHIDQISQLLESFSFSRDESEIYIAALSLGNTTISQISRRVNKSRTATHFHVQKLLERKFLYHVKKKKRQFIAATHPQEILAGIHEKASSLAQMLPQLAALARIESEYPRFDVSELRDGYWRVYEEISYLPRGSSIRMLEGKKAVENELSLLMPHQWELFWQRMIDRNIQTNALFTEELIRATNHRISKAQREFLQKRTWFIRSLPYTALSVDQLMILYKDKAAFLFPDTELVVVLQHRGVTPLLSSMFDSLYALAKPVRNPWQR